MIYIRDSMFIWMANIKYKLFIQSMINIRINIDQNKFSQLNKVLKNIKMANLNC